MDAHYGLDGYGKLTRRITLPHNGWKPRDYQRGLWDYLGSGGKRALAVWHRRAGKDEVLLHHTACAMMERPGNYWYMFPEYAQCRKAMWDAVNPRTGNRRIFDVFPQDLIDGEPNNTEMKLRVKGTGSLLQFVGSDRYDSLVGAGIAGACFTEYALANPSAWAYISPMLRENNGWAAFISTPRGRNHFHSMFEMAKGRGDWFAQQLSIIDTGALHPDQIEDARAEYISLYGEDIGNAMFEQEYMVSFNAAIIGAFYAREMAAVRAEGRIADDLEAIEGKPVHRAWDIGVRDDTAIVWFQVVGGQVYILDGYSRPGISDVEEFAAMVHAKNAERGWTSGTDFVPHDARAKVWGMKRTRVETMLEYGLSPQVVPLTAKLDGINAVRRTLPRCVFHSRCDEAVIPALEQYRREWDDERKTFRASEVHDWSSHMADAFRYMAQSWQEARAAEPVQREQPPMTVGDIKAPKLY